MQFYGGCQLCWKIGWLEVLIDDSYDLIKCLDADIILVHQPPTTVNMRVRQWYCDTAMMDWTHLITPCGEGLQVGWEWDPGDTTLQTCRQHGDSLSSHYFLPLCDKLWSITETTSPPAGHNNLISSIPNIPTTSPSPPSPASTHCQARLDLVARFPFSVSCQPGGLTSDQFNDCQAIKFLKLQSQDRFFLLF